MHLRTTLLATLFAYTGANNVSLRRAGDIAKDGSFRRALQTITEKDCYHECVAQRMTAVQCSAYIKSVLGEDLSMSKYPDLEIKIARPRSAAAKAATYWEVAIPTNIFGEVSCDINDAVITYRDPWVTEAGEQQIPATDCFGLNAAECCNRVMTTVREAGISLTDVNGNCLSCWAHQQVLTPVVSGASGELTYLIHEEDLNGRCGTSDLTPEQVQQVDTDVESTNRNISNEIDRVLQNGASCDELKMLQNELTLHSRSFVHAMVAISKLLCGKCETEDTMYNTIPQDMHESLLRIQSIIQGEIKSDENCIVIYADHSNLVMEPPKVGGSRAIFDYDRDDPDCTEQVVAGDLPDIHPRDPITGRSNGEDVEVDDTGDGDDEDVDDDQCTSTDLVNSSQLPTDPCFSCRRCLLKQCDEWGENRECRKIMKFKIEATPEKWEWCLELNGGLSPIHPTHNDGTAQNWCPCASRCQDECVRADPPTAGDESSSKCTAKNIAKTSGPGEACEDCKVCIQQSCGCWKHQKCRKLLAGTKPGTKAQWAACLKSNGKVSQLEDGVYDGNDGNQDEWGPCAQTCFGRCDKVSTSRV